MTITLSDVQAARGVWATRSWRTPCLPSRTLSEITGADVRLKFENFQYTASFKERGALNRLLQLSEDERAKASLQCRQAIMPRALPITRAGWTSPLSS